MSNESKSFHNRRWLAVAAIGALSAPLLAACGGGGDDGSSGSGDCSQYEQFGEHDGTTVTVYSPIRDIEGELHQEAWIDFEDCTGITVEYEGTGEFEAQIGVKVDAGNAPDIAIFPQPGLLARYKNDLKPVPADVQTLVGENWSEDWAKYGMVDGAMLGAPLGSNVKSFVWYSPKLFAEKGYTVPTTWDELITLSDKMKADGVKQPWCAGIGSGDATGWPATDWLEDMMLRTAGPEVYDQWVNHEIPFNDPKVLDALERAGSILRNPDYVGNVQSIATTTFQDAGLPVAEQECGLHRQASFYAAQWPEGTTVAEDGDVFAFYLPGDDAASKPLLGAGEYVAAFADRPEVQAFQKYLATELFPNERMKLGAYTTANLKADLANSTDPIMTLSMELLRDDTAEFRFDASDLMPAEVGSAAFWEQMTAWLGEGKDSEAVLDDIEAAWPN